MSPNPGPWTFRLALATLIAAVPLVFFGGTVTTLHAGMAIDGWMIVEPGRGDWFLLFYPLERWLSDTGHFVEHSHRLLGTLVGVLSIATVVAAFRQRAAKAVKTAAILGLVAIVVQGVLGGLRVEENSPDLAFVHGAAGQATFAILCGVMVVSSSRWHAARAEASRSARRALPVALFATLVVYAQIVVGAWLRHGRSDAALFTHLVLVVAVIGAVLWLAKTLREAGPSSALAVLPRWLFGALLAQIALGIVAFFAVYQFVGPNPTQVRQALFPTLHVVGGAALLASTLSCLLWSLRVRGEARLGAGSESRTAVGGST